MVLGQNLVFSPVLFVYLLPTRLVLRAPALSVKLEADCFLFAQKLCRNFLFTLGQNSGLRQPVNLLVAFSVLCAALLYITVFLEASK